MSCSVCNKQGAVCPFCDEYYCETHWRRKFHEQDCQFRTEPCEDYIIRSTGNSEAVESLYNEIDELMKHNQGLVESVMVEKNNTLKLDEMHQELLGQVNDLVGENDKLRSDYQSTIDQLNDLIEENHVLKKQVAKYSELVTELKNNNEQKLQAYPRVPTVPKKVPKKVPDAPAENNVNVPTVPTVPAESKKTTFLKRKHRRKKTGPPSMLFRNSKK